MGLRLGFEQLTDSESGASLDVRRTMDLQYTMLLSASRVRMRRTSDHATAQECTFSHGRGCGTH
jgi:hypothetical protein